MRETAKLFTPLKIKSVEIKNRITVSSMCMYSSIEGYANNWHLVHLGSRAVGGAGLVMTEATAVSPEGRISPDDLGIWKDEHIPKLKEIADFVEGQDSCLGIQLAHAGRKASNLSPWKGRKNIPPADGGWQTVAPNDLKFSESDTLPKALDKAGIQKVIDDFKSAAQRALQAGFKVAEIHAAHGYLIHQFLSPLSNKRNDEYGGSFENRIRLLMEITDAINEVWPKTLPLFMRISASDWVDGGWDLEQTVELAKLLKTKGVDLIDCSSGGLLPDVKIPVEKGYQVHFAEKIKKETGMMTGAVGLITKANEAEEILQQNRADLILIAREMLRNPYFPMYAAHELNYDLKWPNQYERGKS